MRVASRIPETTEPDLCIGALCLHVSQGSPLFFETVRKPAFVSSGTGTPPELEAQLILLRARRPIYCVVLSLLLQQAQPDASGKSGDDRATSR